jgi:putative transcription antitermination factor YqgF
MNNKDGILALDFGTIRVGVAISHGFVAEALESLEYLGKEDNFVESLKKIVKEQKVTDIVIGLPLKNGEETEQSSWTRKQVRKISEKIETRFSFVDESYSSLSAKDQIKKNGDLDSESAKIILEQYLKEDEARN